MDFKTRVISFINKVPKGNVVSYGQVAANSGSPRAARQVGAILRAFPMDSPTPWWRVINNQGVLSIKGSWIATKEMQKTFLEKEHIEVSPDFTLDIERYRFKSK